MGEWEGSRDRSREDRGLLGESVSGAHTCRMLPVQQEMRRDLKRVVPADAVHWGLHQGPGQPAPAASPSTCCLPGLALAGSWSQEPGNESRHPHGILHAWLLLSYNHAQIQRPGSHWGRQPGARLEILCCLSLDTMCRLSLDTMCPWCRLLDKRRPS